MRLELAKIARFIADTMLWLCVLTGFMWAFGAIWFHALLPVGFARFLAVVYLLFGIRLVVKSSFYNQRTGASFFKGVANKWARPILAATIPAIYMTTLLVQPASERTWAADQERLPVVRIDGDEVTISNFRNFVYQTPEIFEASYETLSFNIRDLESVWFIVQRFTQYDGMAHTLVSFGLDTPQGKRYFSVSVEIRREEGELYSPTRGIYRQYELMYVVGSEQDLIGVRTNVRTSDRVYLYRGNASPRQVQELFQSFAARIEKLRHKPEFYSTFLNNCTNNLVAHTWSLTPEPVSPFSLRIVLPGYSAEVAFEQKLIGKPDQAFDELQARSQIDGLAREAGITERFSDDIRARTGE